MHARFDSVVDEGLTILSAEDQVRVELRERLEHGDLLKHGDRVRVNMAFGQTTAVILPDLGRRYAYPRLR